MQVLKITDELDLLNRAVVTPAYWDQLLQTVRVKTRSHAGSIQIDFQGDEQGSDEWIRGYFHGYEDCYHQSYLDYFYQLDLASYDQSNIPEARHRFLTLEDNPDYRGIVKGEFYNEWFLPQKLDTATATFHQLPGNKMFKITLQRSLNEAVYQPAELAYLDSLRQRIIDSYTLAQQLDLHKNQKRLSLVDYPAAIIKSDGEVHEYNNRYEVVSERLNISRIHDGQLVFDRKISLPVKQAISRLKQNSLQLGKPTAEFISLGALGISDAFLKLQSFIDESQSKFLFDSDKRLYIIGVHFYLHQLNLKVLKNLYSLTPTEVVTVSLIFKGMSIKQISQKTGQAESTLRSSLKSIYGKCGVNRQAELVSRIAASPAWLDI